MIIKLSLMRWLIHPLVDWCPRRSFLRLAHYKRSCQGLESICKMHTFCIPHGEEFLRGVKRPMVHRNTPYLIKQKSVSSILSTSSTQFSLEYVYVCGIGMLWTTFDSTASSWSYPTSSHCPIVTSAVSPCRCMSFYTFPISSNFLIDGFWKLLLINWKTANQELIFCLSYRSLNPQCPSSRWCSEIARI